MRKTVKKGFFGLCLTLAAVFMFSTVAFAGVLDDVREAVDSGDFTPFEFVIYTDEERGLTLEIMSDVELTTYTERARSYNWSTDGAFLWYQITLPNVDSARLLSAAKDRATNWGDVDGRVVAYGSTLNMAVALGESPNGEEMRIGFLSIHAGFNFIFTAAFPTSELDRYFDVLERLVTSIEGDNAVYILQEPIISTPRTVNRTSPNFAQIPTPDSIQFEGDVRERVPTQGQRFNENFIRNFRYMPYGYGEGRFADGRHFIGYWGGNYGQIISGIMTFPSGDQFEGTFNEGFPVEGAYVFANGEWFVGTFRSGTFYNGTRGFNNGDVYVGRLSGRYPSGNGTLTFANGDVHEGRFWEGLPDGDGVRRFVDGTALSGMWEHGVLVGNATRTLANGEIQQGEWRDGRFHGSGTRILADGTRQSGTWANGTFTPTPVVASQTPTQGQSNDLSALTTAQLQTRIQSYQQAIRALRPIMNTPEGMRQVERLHEMIRAAVDEMSRR